MVEISKGVDHEEEILRILYSYGVEKIGVNHEQEVRVFVDGALIAVPMIRKNWYQPYVPCAGREQFLGSECLAQGIHGDVVILTDRGRARRRSLS